MGRRIVVAEDDTKQAHVIRLYLEHHGHQVAVVHDGQSALDVCRAHHPDLLVLDVMLPRLSGIDVCRVLRIESDIPIVLLTARSTENDLLLGLDAGADDYITKPFSPRELAARVRALLRRSGDGPADEHAMLTHGALEVDTGRFEVRVEGRPVALTAKEFAILEVLVREPGRVFSRAEIVKRATGFEDVLERTVDAHVKNLRRKLEPDAHSARYVLTSYGRGYRLADPC